MPPICQITIIKTEQPVDEPKGEVFKITVFDRDKVVDYWYFHDLASALICVKGEMEDLVSS